MSREVLVVRTGTANLASVCAALRRAGARATVTEEPAAVLAAERVVLPGVGSFAAAMQQLRGALGQAVAARVNAGRPLLAICLGMQLLAQSSEESPGVEGLGVLPCQFKRLPDGVRVPQLGWNRVEPADGCALVRPGYAYFANSYCLASVPRGWSGAWTRHGEPFVSAVERGPILACQFHPELSGSWGAALIARWLARAEEAAC